MKGRLMRARKTPTVQKNVLRGHKKGIHEEPECLAGVEENEPNTA